VLAKAITQADVWKWFVANAGNVDAPAHPKLNREMIQWHKAGVFVSLVPELAVATSPLSFLGARVSMPLGIQQSTGSISMNSGNNTFIYFSGKKHSDCEIQYDQNGLMSWKQPTPEKGKEVEKKIDIRDPVTHSIVDNDIVTGKVVGSMVARIEETDVTKYKDLTVVLATTEIKEVKKDNVKTVVLKSSVVDSTIYPVGFGGRVAQSLGEVLGKTKRESHVILNSCHGAAQAVADLASGITDNLMANSSSSFVVKGAPVVKPMAEKYDVRTAFNHLNQSRTVFGANENGIRALSVGAPYCGLVDVHNKFKEHDMVLAVQDWLNRQAGGEGGDVITGGIVKYNKGFRYFKITGSTDSFAKRLITNIVTPKGVGLFIETPLVYSNETYSVLTGPYPVPCVRDLCLKPAVAIDLKDTKWPEKLSEIYAEELTRYDFVGHLVRTGGGIIPLRCIHRGLVIHCEAGPNKFEDYVQAMIAANIYRNCWLLMMDMPYLEYMTKKVGATNAYVTSFKKVITFNAPYVDTKFMDLAMDSSGVSRASGVDFVPSETVKLFAPVVEQVMAPNVQQNNDYALFQEWRRQQQYQSSLVSNPYIAPPGGPPGYYYPNASVPNHMVTSAYYPQQQPQPPQYPVTTTSRSGVNSTSVPGSIKQPSLFDEDPDPNLAGLSF
jgi:hypothetical protein